jgi:hypothetical protein
MPSYSRKVQLPGKSSQELYEALAERIDRFLEKSSFGKYELEKDSAQKEFRIKSSMFSATLRCGEGELDLDAKLSLIASAFRSKLDEGIDKWLAKTFPTQT